MIPPATLDELKRLRGYLEENPRRPFEQVSTPTLVVLVAAAERANALEAENERLNQILNDDSVFLEIRNALEKALPILERAAEPEPHYGYVVVQDPRDFHPDPECSTEEERANHKADCEAWDRGEHARVAPVHAPIDPERSIAGQIKGADTAVLVRDGEGNITGGHVTKAGYGLGTSMLRDADAEAVLAIARAALGAKP